MSASSSSPSASTPVATRLCGIASSWRPISPRRGKWWPVVTKTWRRQALHNLRNPRSTHRLPSSLNSRIFLLLSPTKWWLHVSKRSPLFKIILPLPLIDYFRAIASSADLFFFSNDFKRTRYPVIDDTAILFSSVIKDCSAYEWPLFCYFYPCILYSGSAMCIPRPH